MKKLKQIKLVKFLCVLLLSFLFGSITNDIERIESITYGTDYCSGKCIGFCRKQKKYNSKYIISTEEYCKQDNKPKIDTTIIDKTRWTNICNYVELDKFLKVPSITGCPGCSDGGIEWIEIVTTKRTHKIKFEYNHFIKEIGGLLVILRNRK
jgi:hypothetical protein